MDIFRSVQLNRMRYLVKKNNSKSKVIFDYMYTQKIEFRGLYLYHNTSVLGDNCEKFCYQTKTNDLLT